MSDSAQGGHRNGTWEGQPVQHYSGYRSRAASYRSNNTSEGGHRNGTWEGQQVQHYSGYRSRAASYRSNNTSEGGHRNGTWEGQPVQHYSGYRSRAASYRSNNTSEGGHRNGTWGGQPVQHYSGYPSRAASYGSNNTSEGGHRNGTWGGQPVQHYSGYPSRAASYRSNNTSEVGHRKRTRKGQPVQHSRVYGSRAAFYGSNNTSEGGHRKRTRKGQPVQHTREDGSRAAFYGSNNTSEDGGQGPSTPHRQPRKYKARKGFATLDGLNFEIKMCALVFLRAVQSLGSFTMTSNDPWAASFDDIVVSYGSPGKEQNILVQLKTSSNRINFTPSSKTPLKDYFQSLEKLNTEYFKDCTYVFFTNADVELEPSDTSVDSPAEKLLRTSWKHGDVFKVDLNDNICKDFRDDTGAEDFVNRLLIFRKQAGVEYLDELIKQELFKICNGFVPEYQTIQDAFVKKIKATWSDKTAKAALDEHWEGWTELKNKLFGQNTLLKQIKFSEETVYHLEKWVLDSESDIIIFKSDSAEAQIACSKVYQTFMRRDCLRVLFTDLSEPQSSQNMLFSLWSKYEWDLLVVTDVTSCTEKLGHNIANYTGNPEEQNKKKIVIVSSGDADKLELPQADEWGTDFIKSTFKQLDVDSQRRVRNLEVDFQGKAIILGKIMDDNILEGGVLQYVLTSSEIQIGTALRPRNEKYIPRTLCKRIRVNDVIYKSDDVFYIGGNDHNIPTSAVPYEEQCRRFKEITRRELYEAISGFKCCKEILREGPVHFLEYIDYSHYWIHSHGSTDDLFKCIKLYPREEEDCKKIRDTNTTLVKEEDLVRKEFQTVIVADEPGNGKTALLLAVANKMKELFSHRWIIYIDLNKHADTLDEIKQSGNVTNECVLRLLSKAADLDHSELGRQLLKYSVFESGDICILFDAFDEIAPPFTDTVLDILKLILSEFKLSTLWIASRYNLRETLEKGLESHDFRIEPLSDEEQIELMSKLWGNTEKAEEFHSAIIDELPFGMRSSPLLINMMCELFSDLDMSDNFSFDVVKLYEQFIEKKFDIYFKEKCDFNEPSPAIGTTRINERELFMERHMLSSLCALEAGLVYVHEPLQSEIREKVKKFCKMIKKGHERLGIIDGVVRGVPHFIHRTFAEFFVAKWLLEHREKDSSDSIITEVSCVPYFQFVNKLFLLQLDAELPVHLAVLNEDIDALKGLEEEDLNETDDLGRTPLHLAAMMHGPKARNVVLELLKYDLDLNIEDDLRKSPLCYADDHENYAVGRILYNRGATGGYQEYSSDSSDSL